MEQLNSTPAHNVHACATPKSHESTPRAVEGARSPSQGVESNGGSAAHRNESMQRTSARSEQEACHRESVHREDVHHEDPHINGHIIGQSCDAVSPDSWTAEKAIALLAEDSVDDVLPPLDILRVARAQLSERVRHHKDEQDSLALDLECHAGGTEIHHLAARVRRLEQFCAAVAAHVSGTMTREVNHVLSADQRHSEEEIAVYAGELQSRRDALFQRIAAVAERVPKGRVDNIRAHTKGVALDAEAHTAIAHVSENERTIAELSEKVKKFRTLRSRLEAEIACSGRAGQQTLERMRQKIKRAQLDVARDTRQCQELNARNATLTTTAQMLMTQLNAEHYGVEGAPTPQQLIEAYKEMTDEETSLSEGISDTTHPAAVSASRRGSAAKPPLVSIKTTASQRMREEAVRERRSSAARASTQCGGDRRRRSSTGVARA